MIGSVTLSGGALLQFAGGQITTIANGGTLALEGVQAFVADAGQTASNSALSGLSAIDAGGKLDLQGSSDVATLGDLTNDGVIIVNAMGFASTTLIIGGVLTNIGSIKLGGVSLASNGDSSGTITLDSLVNTDGNGHLGHIEIQGGPDADDRSVLAVNAAAGLDPSYPGMLTGTVTLSGNALLEFGSGTIRTIAAKSTLGLNGTGAFVADAADTASSSALVGLTTVAGQLDLADFATVTTATTLASTGKISLGQNASLSVAALTNGAVVSLVDDSQLTATGRLANGPKGTIDISDSGVAAGSLVNQNVLDLTGSAHGTATLSLAQAATNAATGTINLDGNSTLDVREALTNNGKVTLKAGMVAIGGDLAGTGTVDFSNVSTIGVLRAAAIAATQTIAGFDAGDTIDLSGTVVSALAFKGNVLSLTEGNGHDATLHFSGGEAGGIKAVTDGHGGTDLIGVSADVNLGGGAETLAFRSGAHTVIAGAADLNPADQLVGGSGVDTLALDGGGIFNLGAIAHFSGFERILLDNTGSTLVLSTKASAPVQGGLGADTVRGAAAADVVSGGGGNDSLAGGRGVDHLVGNTGADILAGGLGADVLNGGLGADVLNGGSGHDRMTGAAGADTFVFDSAVTAANADTITDFAPGQDHIELDHAVFAALAPRATLASGAFVENTSGAAANRHQHVIYDSQTGALFYDQDGSAKAHAAVLVATLHAHLTLSHADFVVV